MNEITISMRLFGAFRQYGETVDFPIRAGSPVAAVKEALGNVLGEEARGLIRDSVLADDDTILPRDFVFDQDTKLSILPPVCGG